MHQTNNLQNKSHYVYLQGFLFASPWNKQNAKTFIRLKAHNTRSRIKWKECIVGKFNQGNGESNSERDSALMPCKLLFHNACFSWKKSWFLWLTQVMNNHIWLTGALVTNNTDINVITPGSPRWQWILQRCKQQWFYFKVSHYATWMIPNFVFEVSYIFPIIYISNNLFSQQITNLFSNNHVTTIKPFIAFKWNMISVFY